MKLTRRELLEYFIAYPHMMEEYKDYIESLDFGIGNPNKLTIFTKD